MYLIKRDDQYWDATAGSFTGRQSDATRFQDKPIADLAVVFPGARYVKLKVHA